MKKNNWKYLTVSCLIAATLTIPTTIAEEIGKEAARADEEAKSNVQLIVEDDQKEKKVHTKKEKSGVSSFFSNLFKGRKKDDSQKKESAPAVLETAEETTEATKEEPTSDKSVKSKTPEQQDNKKASSSGKQPIFSTWFKRTLGIPSKNYEVVDTSKPEEPYVEIEEPIEVAKTEEHKIQKKGFFESFKSIFKKPTTEKSVVESKPEESPVKKENAEKGPHSVKEDSTEKLVVKEEKNNEDVAKEMPAKQEGLKTDTETVATKTDNPKAEKKSFTDSLKSIFKKSDSKKETVATDNSKKKGSKNPFRHFWGKSNQDSKGSKKVAEKSSKFHDPKQIAKPEYQTPSDKESALGVIGEVQGNKVGPFSRPGKYDLSGTQTGLLLPINNKDELNTKEDIVSVIMKQPALMSVDSYSSLSVHKVISINEIILKRGRFRLKTLDKAGLWTIRGRETLLSLSENSDVVFDMTGTLITKIFVLAGEGHCLPKLGEKPIKVQAGQMVYNGLSEIKTMDISEEQKSFFEQRFSLASEESLTAKLDAAGVFSSRSNKNWPLDSKIYSGILCTNCSYAFDSREAYYDVCPVCHTSLIENTASDGDEELIHPAKNKSKTKRSYNWSKWFFGIKSKKSSK